MTFEEFKRTDASEFPIGKLIGMISRGHVYYLNHKLEEFNINASQIHFLFEINREKQLNQEHLSAICNIDKGAVARSIKKLEDLGLILRKVDEGNRRQNIISLTDYGESVVLEVKEILFNWENEVFDNTLIEKEILKKVLKEIVIKTIEINKNL